MVVLGDKTVNNEWMPAPVDMDKVEHECRYIAHAPSQNICVLLECNKYIEIVIFFF